MAGGGTQRRLLRYALNVLVYIGIQKRDQRLDVVHRPANRQIALIKRGGERIKSMKFLNKILINDIHCRIAHSGGKLRHHRIDLLNRGTRRRCLNSRNNQTIHFIKQRGRGYAVPGSLIKRLNMM